MKYFVVDCRPLDQYSCGHLPGSYQLDPNLVSCLVVSSYHLCNILFGETSHSPHYLTQFRQKVLTWHLCNRKYMLTFQQRLFTGGTFCNFVKQPLMLSTILLELHSTGYVSFSCFIHRWILT